MNEAQKYLDLVLPYCEGNGVDIGSGGAPVVSWAVALDLPRQDYIHYNGLAPSANIQWRGDAGNLPFKDGVCDFVFSSHLLEDYLDWAPLLQEWTRVLKPGGYLVIILPDKERWAAALRRGQPPNGAHRHEGTAGELTGLLGGQFTIIRDSLTDKSHDDYSILFVGRKI